MSSDSSPSVSNLAEGLSPSAFKGTVMENLTREEAAIVWGADKIVISCHGAAVKAGWWSDLKTGESLVGKRNVGEQLCLVHSEISEAMEAHRKNLMDDKLPHRKGVEVELADAVIRIADFCGAHNLDLGGAIVDKMRFNAERPDHKIENRKAAGGKAY